MAQTKKHESKTKEEQSEFSYQTWLDNWSKENVMAFYGTVKSFYKNAQKSTTEFVNHDLKEGTQNVSEFYFAQKAIRHHASKSLPFKTLVLLGERLGNEAYKENIQEIINENVIKFDGQYFKLDDSDNITKIHKAIKTYQFEDIDTHIKKAG